LIVPVDNGVFTNASSKSLAFTVVIEPHEYGLVDWELTSAIFSGLHVAPEYSSAKTVARSAAENVEVMVNVPLDVVTGAHHRAILISVFFGEKFTRAYAFD